MKQTIPQTTMVFIAIAFIVVGVICFSGGYVLSYKSSHTYAKNYIDHHCGGLNYEEFSNTDFTFNAEETRTER